MTAGSPATARKWKSVRDSQHRAVTPAAASTLRSPNLHSEKFLQSENK